MGVLRRPGAGLRVRGAAGVGRQRVTAAFVREQECWHPTLPARLRANVCSRTTEVAPPGWTLGAALRAGLLRTAPVTSIRAPPLVQQFVHLRVATGPKSFRKQRVVRDYGVEWVNLVLEVDAAKRAVVNAAPEDPFIEPERGSLAFVLVEVVLVE